MPTMTPSGFKRMPPLICQALEHFVPTPACCTDALLLLLLLQASCPS
jgi:hypothetical protein